jgi:hypothetical protein
MYIVIQMASVWIASLVITLISFCILYLGGDVLTRERKHIIEADCKITDCICNVSTSGQIPHQRACYLMEFEYTLVLKHHTYSQRWIGGLTTTEQFCAPIGTIVPCYYYDNHPVGKTLDINRDSTYMKGTLTSYFNLILNNFVLPIAVIVFFLALLSTIAALTQLVV